METIIQALVIILGLLGIAGTFAEHGQPIPRYPAVAVGSVIAVLTGLIVTIIIFWNPTGPLDTAAWATTIGLLAWTAIHATMYVLTHDPDKPSTITSTGSTLAKLAQNLVYIIACTIGILT